MCSFNGFFNGSSLIQLKKKKRLRKEIKGMSIIYLKVTMRKTEVLKNCL